MRRAEDVEHTNAITDFYYYTEEHLGKIESVGEADTKSFEFIWEKMLIRHIHIFFSVM